MHSAPPNSLNTSKRLAADFHRILIPEGMGLPAPLFYPTYDQKRH